VAKMTFNLVKIISIDTYEFSILISHTNYYRILALCLR